VDIVTPPIVPLSLGLASRLASAAPTFQVGQVIDALVLALIDDDTVRLSLPGLVLDAKTTVQLDPGSTVRLAVQGSGSAVKLVIVGATAAAGAAGSGTAQTINQPSDPTVSIVPQQLVDGEGATGTSGRATIIDVAGLQPALVPAG